MILHVAFATRNRDWNCPSWVDLRVMLHLLPNTLNNLNTSALWRLCRPHAFCSLRKDTILQTPESTLCGVAVKHWPVYQHHQGQSRSSCGNWLFYQPHTTRGWDHRCWLVPPDSL